MDLNNSLVVGAGALIVGIIIGYSMSGSGEEVAEQSLAQTHALSEKVDTLTSRLDERVAGIASAVAALSSAQSDAAQGIGTRIDAVSQSVSGAVDKLGGGVSEALKSQFDTLKEQIAGLGGRAGREAAAPAETEVAAPAATGAATGKPLTPGQTAVLTGGKLYVFLSQADPKGGMAMVAINGQTLTQLDVGKAQNVNGCAVTLTGFDASGAALIDGGC